ncbi:type II secretion system protein GspJ [Enterobacter bugandensis]|uniref:type II secretion system protein GspJ n=1 Tax=Enterobacter bugandensis TaxID=881260 RepID=UPI0021D0C475|nr:type II secretion system protein GspJ [Enterobacter bugandensis]MCU6162851.1 prepilin-type N-terminal cleavage/methylation domain-containing protein [Enterobacter bugandensis]MCU6217493.1 prepilin-type N-terminal cleavage/methylation domain-containing protein [Enterobacter bugandensis]
MSECQRGFTLLEVVLAIAILSTLGFLASMIFSQATEQHARAKDIAEDFRTLQRTELMLESDLMQYVPRINRQTHLTFQSGNNSALFTTQVQAPDDLSGATFNLATVHWFVKENTLYRAVRRYPDSLQEERPHPMLSDVASFSIAVTTSDQSKATLLATVTLERTHQGTLMRRYRLPDWTPERQEEAKP